MDSDVESIIHEIIISVIKNEPVVYDKTFESKLNITKLRNEVFETASQAIFCTTKQFVSVKEVANIWKNLLRKFNEELKKEDAYCPSGSSSNVSYNSSWPFYKSLLFLKPHVNHRQTISSKNVEYQKDSAIFELETVENVDSKSIEKDCKSSKKKERMTNETAVQSLENINRKIDILKTSSLEVANQNIKNYIPMIKKGFKKIAEDKKFLCTTEIINFIVEFKKRKNTSN